MATFIPADGSPTSDIQPANGSDFTFAELYPLLGCDMIEIVYHVIAPGCIMLIDECGKLADKPANQRATRLLAYGGDYIAGNAVVCRQDEVK